MQNNHKSPLHIVLKKWFIIQEKSNPESKHYIACSGGIDSMVLLNTFYELKEITGDFEVIYVNHKQRKNVVKDISTVHKFCKKKNIHFNLLEIKIKKNASENELREARYSIIFKFLKEQNKNSTLWLAHHQSDQLETLFFKILRGTNLKSLRGMKEQDVRNGIVLMRPFLMIDKSIILAELKKKKISYSHDETNSLNQYSRNLLRNKVFPLLNKVHPGALVNLNRFICEISRSNIDRNHFDPILIQEVANSLCRFGVELKGIQFELTKAALDQLLGNRAAKTTRHHWIELKKQIDSRQNTKNGGGPKKIVQFPGGNFALFKGNKLYWNKA